MAEPLTRAVEQAGMADWLDFPAQPEPTPEATRTTRVLHEAVAHHLQRVLGFDRLDGKVRRVGGVHLHAVPPIPIASSPKTTAERFEVEVIVTGARVPARKHSGGV